MQLQEISATGFRNLHSASVPLSAGVNLVVGENGQGKTNLLEAIYYVSTLKPLRTSRLQELVAWGEESFELRAVVSETISRELRVVVQGTRRVHSSVDSKPAAIDVYSDVLKTVAFTPDEMQIVKGPAALRRRWIDRSAFTRLPGYLSLHRQFDRALKARNSLLKRPADKRSAPLELEAFDEAMANAGARLVSRRLEVLAELRPLVEEKYRAITGLEKCLELNYSSPWLDERVQGSYGQQSEARIKECLLSRLRERRRIDLARGHSTIGPQADDVEILLDRKDIRAFGSQGQQRAAILAMKIGEIENLQAVLGRTPVLLLDDISSELDPVRNAQLIGYLSSFSGQAFITTTDPSIAAMLRGGPQKRLFVTGGRIREERG